MRTKWAAGARRAAAVTCAGLAIAGGGLPALAVEDDTILAPGTIRLSNATVPFSVFASAQAKSAFVASLTAESPPRTASIREQREFYAKASDALVARMRPLFPVDIAKGVIGGVEIETVVPQGGVDKANDHRVLLYLHSGAFMWGAGSGGEVGAIPIASVGKIKVINVDYREAPENLFPAASDDVTSVFRSLLATYRPEDIGIFGCSAGGILATETIARLDKEHLPKPGAIGTFCGSASEIDGDSATIAPMVTRTPGGPGPGVVMSLPYFKGADPKDPLVFPINSPALLAKFPPTLMISGTRDFALSSVLRTHAALTKAGVDAELHVWDGMWHEFFADPDLPESKEEYQVVASFFARHLGHR